ncbi:acyl-[ACP]--phospholipid O-acyltransferase [Marinobacterium rhizophilum]|uniref:Acyl-[ACP]--phospholipid O-acyltransferase n=1 Tax=Marinobacterium rhizophilum TaxID=420402 RepID=A0ABY5HJQ4_9GAMM|nr:acyl-[ACP]--phospholipid O-acyltransferase [Marinobacterium rhizophilum]UTW12520.1 acyl-[ACP]--phospholipid O-acyltransferase [Marinobacterium rhizophilum]
MSELFKLRGFLAFVSVAFINAFVDLGHKIIIQNTLFKTFDGQQQILLTAVVNGLILLPFIMLFTPAGFISDKYPKHRVMRFSAWAGVLVTLLITLCYYQGWFVAAFGLTFVLALQSAFYSPSKYGYIRELVGTARLSEGNGWIQAATMVAILSGIMVFSLLFEMRLADLLVLPQDPAEVVQQIAPLGWFLVAGAALETVLAHRLPALTKTDRQLHFDWAAYRRGRTLAANLSHIAGIRPIWLSILGLATFWSISQVMLAVFPAFAKETLGEQNTFVIQGAMALAGIGIMAGSMLAGRLSRHHINTGLIPLGAAGVALGLLLLPHAASLGFSAALFLMIGLFGALMIIPLNALIQFNADRHDSGRILAGNNFIQNVAMLSFLGLTVLCAFAGISGLWLLYGLGVLALAGAVFAIVTLPEALIRLIVAMVLKRKYRLQVLGFEHLPEDGRGTLLLGNHISWLDWAMVQMACPRHVHFVMERSIYERWYLRGFLDLFGVIPISGGNSRAALTRVSELLQAGKVVCLFPEGSISHTGQLGTFKKGFERACEGIAQDSAAVIVPFYLRGLWGSRFSRSSSRLQASRRHGLKRDLIVAFGAPAPLQSTAEQVKKRVFELSIHAWNSYTDTLETLPRAFIRTARQAPAQWAISDVRGAPLSYPRLLCACALFSRRFKKVRSPNIGLLLPTSSAGAIANMAALMAGKALVNLNFTATPQALLAAAEQAQLDTIVTARQFLVRLESRGIDTQALFAGRTVLYMEDIKASIGKVEALSMLVAVRLLPVAVLQAWLCRRAQLDDTAAILFSSGSEGAPKGVMLSHRNILSNIKQIGDVLNVRDDDCWMATLPLFHAFGLTVTCLLPLIEGIPVVCHPDPTDAVNIGKGVARFRATLMCATSTFMRLYVRNRKLHPLMFQSLRLMVAGAERLDPAVRDAFEARFHVPVLEGYGCTETTPVATVNLPDHLDTRWWTVQHGSRAGTVGLALPGSTVRIVDPATLEELPAGEAGLVLIGGTQIMRGYLNDPERTAAAIVERDGLRWYNTGDKGRLDEEGFLSILDRYARFAKIGGEMVSLQAVEDAVAASLDGEDCALLAVALPDARKGERVVLLVAPPAVAPQEVRRRLMASVTPLLQPSEIYAVDEIPLLGSGKRDFAAARVRAQQLSDARCETQASAGLA